MLIFGISLIELYNWAFVIAYFVCLVNLLKIMPKDPNSRSELWDEPMLQTMYDQGWGHDRHAGIKYDMEMSKFNDKFFNVILTLLLSWGVGYLIIRFFS